MEDHNFGGENVGLNLDSYWIWLLLVAPAIGSFLGLLAVRLPRTSLLLVATNA